MLFFARSILPDIISGKTSASECPGMGFESAPIKSHMLPATRHRCKHEVCALVQTRYQLLETPEGYENFIFYFCKVANRNIEQNNQLSYCNYFENDINSRKFKL